MPTRTTLVMAVIATMLAAGGESSFGQQITIGSHTGTIVGVRGMEVGIKSNIGNPIIASLDPEGTINGIRLGGKRQPLHIEVTGEFRGEHLTKGAFVRFMAKLQGKKNPRTVEPVKKLEVFTPAAGTQFGLLDEGVVGGGEDDADADPIREARVVGRVTKARGTSVTVEIPKGSVNVTLAEDAVVDVNINKLLPGMNLQGATATVEGYQLVGAPPPVKLLATKLQVQLPPPPPPKTKVARAPTGEGDDKPAEGGFGPPEGNGAGEEKVATDGIKTPGKILKVN